MVNWWGGEVAKLGTEGNFTIQYSKRQLKGADL